MAIIYVDSGASGGANDGTTKTDAYTSVASVSPSSGDVIWISHTHSETVGNTILAWNNATAALCVNFSTDAVATGADCYSTGYWVIRCKFLYGIQFRSNNNQIQFPHTIFGVADNCTFKNGYLNHYCSGELRSCTIDHSGLVSFAANRFTVSGHKVCVKDLTVIQASSTNPWLWDFFGNGSQLEIEDSDLSQTWSTSIIKISSGAFSQSVAILRRCKVADMAKIVDNDAVSWAQRAIAESCAVGTLSAPALLKAWHPEGNIVADLTRYRTGGADDGEQANPYSWAMTSDSGSVETYTPLESPPMAKWVASGSQTVTIYVASGATLNDDDLWVEVSSPSEAGSPTAQHKWQTTRANPLATPAALATDSGSTWNGTGVGTKQKIDVSIAPAIAGPVVVRAFLAKPSTTVYLDPRIDVA